PYQAVNASLTAQHAVSVIAGHRKSGGFEPRFLARLIIIQGKGEAVTFRPSLVHAEQHLGPVLRLGPARSRVNRDDGVQVIVFTGEKGLRLNALHLLPKRL